MQDSSLHLHEVPLAVCPLHPEGKLYEVAYEMDWDVIGPNGKPVWNGTETVRFGVPYAIEQHRTVRHKVKSISSTHLSISVGDITDGFHSEGTGRGMEKLSDVDTALLVERARHAIQRDSEALENELRSLFSAPCGSQE